jgi:AcrR family transcriptional regulator
MTCVINSVKLFEGEAIRESDARESRGASGKIVEVAGTLFRQHGFEGAGVADIMMKGAGLTHGGFYGHFDSKDDLTAEVTSRVLGNEGWIKGRPAPRHSRT